MSDSISLESIDKSDWGDGPWQMEPDRVEWEHAGLPCLMVRHPRLGNWCGYAALTPGHPLYGHSNDDCDVDVHGGVTYTGACSGHICHIPKPGEPEDVWWIGFDCGHWNDLSPGLNTLRHQGILPPDFYSEYRTLDYVHTEVCRLAEQLVTWSDVAQQ